MYDIVKYSYGICSAYIACRLKETCHDPICVFNDTKREDKDTYRFGVEVAEIFQLNVVEISDGRDLWEVFEQEDFIPARQLTSCSKYMKIKPGEKFLKNFSDPARFAFGYDIDEADRADRMHYHWKYPHLELWFPLIEWGVSKEQCFGYFREKGIDPPRIYKHFNHANCLPCKNFRRPDWVALQYHYPEEFKEAMEFEERTGLKWMQDKDMPRLIELPILASQPSRKGRRKLAGDEPAFNFDMGCDACAVN
jgi:3'-phosphoadenosine 5'-phosphosulfate sulfotransferase (PAPS reductase)/FAD synthetase